MWYSFLKFLCSETKVKACLSVFSTKSTVPFHIITFSDLPLSRHAVSKPELRDSQQLLSNAARVRKLSTKVPRLHSDFQCSDTHRRNYYRIPFITELRFISQVFLQRRAKGNQLAFCLFHCVRKKMQNWIRLLHKTCRNCKPLHSQYCQNCRTSKIFQAFLNISKVLFFQNNLLAFFLILSTAVVWFVCYHSYNLLQQY